MIGHVSIDYVPPTRNDKGQRTGPIQSYDGVESRYCHSAEPPKHGRRRFRTEDPTFDYFCAYFWLVWITGCEKVYDSSSVDDFCADTGDRAILQVAVTDETLLRLHRHFLNLGEIGLNYQI